jgi:predicted nucleic acid-binding protein
VLYLLDTNVVLRLMLVDEPDHPLVRDAIFKLEGAGHEFACTTQTLREIWHIGTRTPEANGLGRTPIEIQILIAAIRSRFRILAEDANTLDLWLAIVSKDSIKGAACHDANHAAVAKSHGVDRVLTFDTSHFNRFKSSGIQAIRPQDA